MDKAAIDALQEVFQALLEKFRDIDRRIAALEAKQPEPLTFPPIDLGLVGGTDADENEG